MNSFSASNLPSCSGPTPARIPILHLTSTSDMGGAERMVLWLAEALKKGSYEPHIGSLVGSGELIRRAAEVDLPAVHFQFRGYFDPGGIRRLMDYIRRHRIQLVQTHGLRADSVARWAARLAGARVVVSTIHSIDPDKPLSHRLLDRITAVFVDQFVAVCEAAKDARVRREALRPSKIEVVPIGLPPRQIPREQRDSIRAELGIAAQAWPVVGILANLREMKGHRYVVDALPKLLESYPDIVVLFAGRDDSGGQVESYAKEKGVASSIRFLGYYQDTAKLLAAMDIFLLPSTWEGLPVSILEALHAGVPVIATEVGGIPEIIRNGQEGVLIEPRNPEQIVAAVKQVAENWAFRAELIRAADVRAQTVFSLSTMTARMEQIYARSLDAAAQGKS